MEAVDRRERKREEKRSAILDAAERTFYRRGLDASRMQHVAEEAQVGKGTLYLYFRDKEELLMGLVARRQRRLLDTFHDIIAQCNGSEGHGSGVELVARLLEAYARNLATPPQHLRLVISRWATGCPFDESAPGAAEIVANVARLYATVTRAIAEGQADGTIRDDLEAGRIALQLWSAVNGALLLQLQLGCLAAGSPMSGHVAAVSDHIDVLLDMARSPRERAEHRERRAAADPTRVEVA